MTTPATQEWLDDHLRMLDQRKLPHEVVYQHYESAAEIAQAIKDMVVRGAPAIGHSAAFAMAIEALNIGESDDWVSALAEARKVLAESRPTAVNLFWVLDRCDQIIAQAEDVPSALSYFAERLFELDIEDNKRMGDFGASLLGANATVYTHCNAGALATAGYGTALGVIRSAHAQGKIKQVFAGETRPWLQGARLTVWELLQENIPVKLAVEGAAGHNMKTHKVDWVIVGSDRIAANGDVANKIGTYNLAILAKHHGAKVMVAAPTNTIDRQCENGELIPIEERGAEEISHWQGKAVAAANCPIVNPAFDVTPASLIDAIVTERGIIENPNAEKIAAHFEQE